MFPLPTRSDISDREPAAGSVEVRRRVGVDAEAVASEDCTVAEHLEDAAAVLHDTRRRIVVGGRGGDNHGSYLTERRWSAAGGTSSVR